MPPSLSTSFYPAPAYNPSLTASLGFPIQRISSSDSYSSSIVAIESALESAMTLTSALAYRLSKTSTHSLLNSDFRLPL